MELPDCEVKDQNVTLYCELLQYSGKEVDVVGEWTGRISLHCINSHMEIYFSTHFLSCAVSASIHCIFSDFLSSNGEYALSKSIRLKKFYSNSGVK